MTHFQIDNDHTAVGFAARHMLLSTVRGRFNNYRTQLELDTDDLTQSRVEVDIDAGSVDTAVPARDAHLRSQDFFDVEHYPTLRFVSRKVERLYPAHFRVTGELTIKDTTREIALDVEFGGIAEDLVAGTRLGFIAKGSIERREFGLLWDKVLDAGGLVVGDKIELVIEAEAVSGTKPQAWTPPEPPSVSRTAAPSAPS